MGSFSIGLSGLTASQRALDIIGNNITNAATEGYHRQTVQMRAATVYVTGTTVTGGGVVVENASRLVDNLLEQEILRQKSNLEQTSRELSTLSTIESAISDIDTGGLGGTIDEFFSAFQNLSLHPTEDIYRQATVTAAESLASQFRTMGDFFDNLGTELTSEAEITVEQINSIVAKIAKVNGTIQDMEVGGAEASNLRDTRDQYISELSELISIQTIDRGSTVDVSFNGMSLVTDRSYTQLDVELQDDGKLGIAAIGDDSYQTDIEGGSLGALFTLKNETVPGYSNQIDTLAKTIITVVNQQHVQGIGANGSFESLTGSEMIDEDLADFDPPVNDGRIYFRVTDAAGSSTRQYIDVSTSETLSDIATKIDGLDNISASVIQGKLHIESATGYKFDFLPGVLSKPTTNGLTGTATPTLSGSYSGQTNQTFTCTVLQSGDVSSSETLDVEVRDEGGNLVNTLSLGQGYVPGSDILIANDVYISFNSGTLKAGESFTYLALANSDTSGVLATTGINTFFKGNGAANFTLDENIAQDASQIATSLSSDKTNNSNAALIAKLADAEFESLGDKTATTYYKNTVALLGQEINITSSEEESATTLLQNLQDQQDELSGVDLNEEAADLIIYERMFQSVGNYMQTAKEMLDSLMNIM